MTIPSTGGNQLLPHRDQKAYDLGARSALEVVDELRDELQTVTEERDEALLRADEAEGALEEARNVTANQGSHMGWLEQQLRASGYRERAYGRVIREGAARMLKEAQEILEGGGLSTAEAQVIEILGRQIDSYHGKLTAIRSGAELVAAAMEEGATVKLAAPGDWRPLVAGWAAELRDLLAEEPSPPFAKSEPSLPAPITEADVCGC